ncbi:MAG: hypothetical protein GY870_22060 [archaeon]|nr:hypothetical protein [archaeon]
MKTLFEEFEEEAEKEPYAINESSGYVGYEILCNLIDKRNKESFVERIEKVKINGGDTIILKMKGGIEKVEKCLLYLRDIFPKNRVIVLDKESSLEIIDKQIK